MTDIIEPSASPLADFARECGRMVQGPPADFLNDVLRPITPEESAWLMAEGMRRYRRYRHKQMQKAWLRRVTR